MSTKVTILGIGNILMQDEGFGVHVVKTLQQRYAFPDEVEILDGGTLGMGLFNFLIDTERLIIIDAINGNLPPGSLYEFKNEAVANYFNEKVSMHELGIKDVLVSLAVLDKSINDITVIGVEPLVIDIGVEMTSLITAKVDETVCKILELLTAWCITFREN